VNGRALSAAALGLLWLVLPAGAQSLADLARQEQARLSTVQTSGKTYTNGDLTPDLRGEARTVSADDMPAAAGTAEPAADAAVPAPNPTSANTEPAAEAADDPQPALDEALWRRRAAAHRTRVEDARQKLARVSGPSEGDERQQAKVAELRATAEGVLQRAEAALAGFEREARMLRVPEAWIR
jgi:hypothetical protein